MRFVKECLQYHATAPESVPEKRAASTVSNSSAVSSRGQKAGQQPQTHADGRPVWKPAGGMDPTKREEFFRNRMRAKEIAERTRQEILASGRYDSEDDDENSSSVEASEESIRDALGPFSRPGNGGPPPLDQEGNELPTANTFAHTILKVMDKYDTPLPAKAAGDAATNLAQGMTLSSRPSTSQKKIISYPVPTKKKKVTLVDVPPTPEPQPNEPEIVEQVDAPLPPEPKPAIPELTPKEKLHRKAFSFVSKLDEERMAPRPQQDPCTPHEIRMIFVNGLEMLYTYPH
ncbi:hypothetical protein BC829DRAFT_179493 [Chytridium lagenaria]|nr:hypothetical protein BC829DRAFT_179493 [Chytridium lagenaria]